MSQESDSSDDGEEIGTKVIYCFFVPQMRTTIWPCAIFKSFFKIRVSYCMAWGGQTFYVFLLTLLFCILLITFLQEQPSRRCKSSYVENLFSLEEDSLSAVALFPFGGYIVSNFDELAEKLQKGGLFPHSTVFVSEQRKEIYLKKL